MAYTKAGTEMIKAAKAHTDMNVFGAVVTLLEGGLISADCYEASEKIRKICDKEMGKCLRRYDDAIRKAGGGAP